MKTCTVCGERKPLEDFHRTCFNKTDGRRGTCKPCTATKNAAKYAADPSRHRASIDRHRYGMEPGDYERMFAAQGGRCAVCGRHADVCPRHSRGRALHVDHDHATGRVRGLLCVQCNLAIGYWEKTGATIDAVAAYLA